MTKTRSEGPPIQVTEPLLVRTARDLIEQGGLSVIPVNDQKGAVVKWTPFREKPMTTGEVTRYFRQRSAWGIAVLCGDISGGLEVIDIDVKNDPSGTIADEYFALIINEAPEILPRLVKTRTMSGGYHLIYRCSRIEMSQHLAETEEGSAMIETRGQGWKEDKNEDGTTYMKMVSGYAVIPPSPGYQVQRGSMLKVPTITPDERDTLISLARRLNRGKIAGRNGQKVVQDPRPAGEVATKYQEGSIAWDYTQRGLVVALLEGHGWIIDHTEGSKVHMTRPGKKEGASGNWDPDHKVFYVFTTGDDITHLQGNQGYNPFQLYAHLECDGDEEIARETLQADGYGPQKKVAPAPDPEPAIPPLPIDGMPRLVQDFIRECVDVYQVPRDFFTGAVISATALAIGNKLELVTRYRNVPVLWTCIVGDVSSGKSETIRTVFRPFTRKDNVSHEEFKKQQAENRSKKRRGEDDDLTEAEFFQYLLNDYTPEALAIAHQVNKRGLMILRDELKGWLDDFNRYNKSGEQSNMISSWSGISITYNRKQSPVIHIPQPTINVMGGMQPDLLNGLISDNRAENGFMSRMCFIYPDGATKPPHSDREVSSILMSRWEDFIGDLLKIPDKMELTLTPEAKDVYRRWYDQNAIRSNAEPSGYVKGILGKLDIISLRLAIVLKGMSIILDNDFQQTISASQMEHALELTEYFRATAMKVYRQIFGTRNNLETKKVAEFLFYQCGQNKTQVAKALGIHRQQVQRWINT